jgi:hypothetical protein
VAWIGREPDASALFATPFFLTPRLTSLLIPAASSLSSPSPNTAARARAGHACTSALDNAGRSAAPSMCDAHLERFR